MNIDEIVERNEFLFIEVNNEKRYLNNMQAIVDLKSKNKDSFDKAWKFFNSSYECLQLAYISTICRIYEKKVNVILFLF